MAVANHACPKRWVGAGERGIRQQRDQPGVGLRASGRDVSADNCCAADGVVGHSTYGAARDCIADDGERVAGARERGGGGDRRARERRVGQERDGIRIGLRANGVDVGAEGRHAVDGVVGQFADEAAGDSVADDGERVAIASNSCGVGDRCAGKRCVGQKRNGVGIGLHASGGDRSGERRDAATTGGKIPNPGKRSVDRSRAAEVERQIVAAANQARPKRWVGADEFCIG